MATRNDFESVLDDVKLIMTTHLNTKITAIVADKGDGITPPAINANAYFLQTLDEAIANFDPFVAYGIQDITSVDTQYGQSQQQISISIVIVLSDNGRSDINRVLFRYSRALKEIFEENFKNANIGNKIIVRQFTPVPFEALDSSMEFKAIGVILETHLV
jgi:hypothetical protein